jgi:hypothetical protein
MANKKKQDNALLASLNTIKESPTQPASKKAPIKKVAKKVAKKASTAVKTGSPQTKQATREVIQALPRGKRVWPD